MKQGFLIVMTVLGLITLFPGVSSAEVLYSTGATGSSASSTGSSALFCQSLGSGLSGRLTSLNLGLVSLYTSTSTHDSPHVLFAHADTDGCSQSVTQDFYGTFTPLATGTPAGYIQKEFSYDSAPLDNTELEEPGIFLDSDKYYFVYVVFNPSDDVSWLYRLSGTTTDSYSAGECEESGFPCPGGLLDLDIELVGARTGVGGISNFIRPEPGSYGLENLLRVTFDYSPLVVPYSTAYDKVGVEVYNLTSGLVFSGASPYEQDANGAQFDETFVLPAGTYVIRPYMDDTVDTKPRFYGETRQVRLLESAVEPEYDEVSSVPQFPAFATTSVTGPGGTTTITIIPGGYIFQEQTERLLYSRIIISYIQDFWVLIKELSTGQPAGNVSYTLPLGAVYTNASTSVSTTTITVLDVNALSQNTIVQTSRNIMGYALYLITAFAIVTSAINLF